MEKSISEGAETYACQTGLGSESGEYQPQVMYSQWPELMIQPKIAFGCDFGWGAFGLTS